MANKICNHEPKNYLKKIISSKLERSNSRMLLATFLTDMDILSDIYIKLYFTNYHSNMDTNIFVTLRIENTKILKIPFYLLRHWMAHEKRISTGFTDFNDYYVIPLEIFNGEFQLFSLNSNKMRRITVEIHYLKTDFYTPDIYEIISLGEALVVGKYVNFNSRSAMIKENIPVPIQVLQCMHIKNTNHFELEIPLHFHGPCKGLILMGEEISDIEEISLIVNGVNIISYDRDKICLFTEFITSRMIYVPLDHKYKLKDISTNSFQSVFYFSNEVEKFDVSLRIRCPVQSEIFILACTMTYYMIKNNIIFYYSDEIINNSKSFKYVVEKGQFAGNKLIDPLKSYCVISQDFIKRGENYAECDTCKNTFLNKHLHTYFEMNHVRICPYCRKEWNEDNYYFCNNDTSANSTNGIYLEENMY